MALALNRFCQGNWPCLQRLVLTHNKFAETFATLQADCGCPHLKGLYMSNCCIGYHEVLHELSRITWSELEMVDLRNNGIHDAQLVVLAMASWHKLVAMKLDGNNVWSAGMMHLSKCSWPLLECLHACRSPLTEPAFAHLCTASWPMLKKLDLCNNNTPLRAAAVAYLTKGNLPLLECLCLCGNRLQGIDVLCELVTGVWPVLQKLHLAKNEFPPEGAAVLSTGNWPQLQELTVSFTVLDRCVVGPFANSNWSNLRRLDINCVREGCSVVPAKAWLLLRADCVSMCTSRWPDVCLRLPECSDVTVHVPPRCSWTVDCVQLLYQYDLDVRRTVHQKRYLLGKTVSHLPNAVNIAETRRSRYGSTLPV